MNHPVCNNNNNDNNKYKRITNEAKKRTLLLYTECVLIARVRVRVKYRPRDKRCVIGLYLSAVGVTTITKVRRVRKNGIK